MTLNTAVSAFVQSEVSDAMRGRVMAVYTVISMGGSPVGAPVIGWISQHAGVRWGLSAGAAIAILAAVGVALWLARRPPASPTRGTPADLDRPRRPLPHLGTSGARESGQSPLPRRIRPQTQNVDRSPSRRLPEQGYT